VLENVVMEQIARCASSLEFEGSSAWNDEIGPAQIGVLARETTTYSGGLDQFNFDCILAELDEESQSQKHSPQVGHLDSPAVKFSLVMGNEYGMKKKFTHNLRPDEVSHYDLITTMNSRVTPETKERYVRHDPRFEKTVHDLLKLVRPLSFNYA
jgi:hypothetical protein